MFGGRTVEVLDVQQRICSSSKGEKSPVLKERGEEIERARTSCLHKQESRECEKTKSRQLTIGAAEKTCVYLIMDSPSNLRRTVVKFYSKQEKRE